MKTAVYPSFSLEMLYRSPISKENRKDVLTMAHKDVKSAVLDELESRISRLEEHEDDHKEENGNPYEKMNHALSHVIGHSLSKELNDLKDFVEGL